MIYAVVSAVGFAAGCMELYLLSLFVKALLKSDFGRVALLFPFKLVILAGGLLPALLIAPELLWLAAAAVILPLVAGGIAQGLKSLADNREGRQ